MRVYFMLLNSFYAHAHLGLLFVGLISVIGQTVRYWTDCSLLGRLFIIANLCKGNETQCSLYELLLNDLPASLLFIIYLLSLL